MSDVGNSSMLPIDLHVHSNCSDGTLSPSELVEHAMELGLAAFALTDHDCIDGISEAVSHAEKLKAYGSALPVPEVIPGIELSTEYHGMDVHLVGLYIDYKDREFIDSLKHFVDSRTERNRKICSLLNKAGIPIKYEDLLEAYPDSVITRAHYASYLFEKGFVKHRQEAFDRYVGNNAPCYVPREKITPSQAISLILKAKGAPVLAHPVLYHMSDNELDLLTGQLKEDGLMGIEAIYSTYSVSDQRRMRKLAAKYKLLLSGGSDFHGANKPNLEMGTGYGNLFIPQELLFKIKESLAP